MRASNITLVKYNKAGMLLCYECMCFMPFWLLNMLCFFLRVESTIETVRWLGEANDWKQHPVSRDVACCSDKAHCGLAEFADIYSRKDELRCTPMRAPALQHTIATY